MCGIAGILYKDTDKCFNVGQSLVKMLDGVSEDEITSFNIPTGIPLVYELDGDLRPLSREFLGDPDAIAAALAAVANQAKAG